jgi:hypothetical protein
MTLECGEAKASAKNSRASKQWASTPCSECYPDEGDGYGYGMLGLSLSQNRSLPVPFRGHQCQKQRKVWGWDDDSSFSTTNDNYYVPSM